MLDSTAVKLNDSKSVFSCQGSYLGCQVKIFENDDRNSRYSFYCLGHMNRRLKVDGIVCFS